MAGGGQPARVPLRELMDERLLDALLERSKDEAGGLRLTGAGSMLGELVAAVLKRALQAELAAHLGYGKHETAGRGSGNSRNGYIAKTVQTGIGPVPLAVPRDRAGQAFQFSIQARMSASRACRPVCTPRRII